MKNLFDIRDRVVVVTGGAGILGRSICAYLAEQGAKVVVLDRDEKAGSELVSSIRGKGGEALFLTTEAVVADKPEKAAPMGDPSGGSRRTGACPNETHP